MKKLLGFLLLVAAVGLLFFFPRQRTVDVKKSSPMPSQVLQAITSIQRQALFVPYWSQNTIPNGYNTYIYFGITPNMNGINMDDAGYKGLPAFAEKTQEKKTLLAVRMIDTTFTQKVLQDEGLQERITQGALQAAQAYGFNGIVLDLEYSGLAFPSVTQGVTNFSVRFAREVKARNISFYQALYGDTYYLDRPYRVSDIAKNADGIFVMSYDFHKANGTPGPNFPLARRDDSDYTFAQMIADFSKDVSKNKLTIIFGMFGYDWTIDARGRSIGQAKSLSDNETQSIFTTSCKLKNCNFQRDSVTQEPSATYIDEKGQSHVVWWEDMQSVGKKKDILQKNGVSQIGFWANGNFYADHLA